jgi:bifunctional non-homologous end joining protein LigD
MREPRWCTALQNSPRLPLRDIFWSTRDVARLGFPYRNRYPREMSGAPPQPSGFIAACISTRAYRVPFGPGWMHEVKNDDYRLQVRRDGEIVLLFTRRGYDWSGRYPAVARTAAALRCTSFTIDAEAVVCGPDGVAIFDALQRHGTVSEAMLYAFDLLELDGEDLLYLPLGDRKKRLARLVSKRQLGIVLSAHTDEDGAFALVACVPHGP